MKVLATADLHYHLRKLDWIVHAAKHVDLVILAGDHLEIASHVQRPAQAIVVQKYLGKIMRRAKLIVSSGNHDLDSQDAQGERIAKWISKLRFLNIPTDGDSLMMDDTLFSVLPWSDGAQAESRVADQLANDATKEFKKWIWVHHQPPQDSTTAWDGKTHHGAIALRHWIDLYQPDFVIAGHVHQSPYVDGGSWADKIGKSWIFNAGHQMSGLPPHIVFDTEDTNVFWKSVPAVEALNTQANHHPATKTAQEPPSWIFSMDQEEAPVLK